MSVITKAILYDQRQQWIDSFSLNVQLLGLQKNYNFLLKLYNNLFCRNKISPLILPASFLCWLLLLSLFLITYIGKLTIFSMPSSKPKWIIGSITVSPIIGISVLFLYLSQPSDPVVLQQLLKFDQMRTARAIRDSNGDLIGAIPNPKKTIDKFFNHEQRQGALYVEYVPDVLWDVLVAREDRGLDFDYENTTLLDILSGKKTSYKGIDLFALIKRPIQSLLKGNNLAGGSALININIKNLYGTRYFKEKYNSNKLMSKLGRKLEEIRGARHLFPYLAQENGREFKRMTSMNAPLLVSAGDIYGIRSASATFFGKRPNDLSEAEQAILAAAYHRNIRFTPKKDAENPSLSLARTKRWNEIIKKAKKGVENAYQTTAPVKMASIISEIEKIKSPQAPKVPSSLEPLLKNLSFNQSQQYGNLALRTNLLVGGVSPTINNQMIDAEANLSDLQVITDINLTLPVGKNISFKKNVDRAFERMLKKCPSCYTKKIGSPLTENGALVYIAVTNHKGEIVRYYRRGSAQRRPIASISKVPASVLLVNTSAKANELFCNKAYKDRRNASGIKQMGVPNCNTLNKSGHSYSFFETIGQSKNLPLFDALSNNKNITKESLLNLYRSFSLQDSSSMNGLEPTKMQLAFELAFGVAEGTPELVHEMFQNLTDKLFQTGYSQDPHIIKSIRVSEYVKSAQRPSARKISLSFPRKIKGIEDYLTNEKTIKQVKEVLSSPVKSKKGTLNSFNKIPHTKFLIAKSGTSETPNSVTRDKWSAGSFSLNNQIYTFTIFIGTDDITNGLGKNIKHQNVMYPIMKEIVYSLR